MTIQESPDLVEAQLGSGLFDALPLPVCLVDAHNRLVAMNGSALAFWGVDAKVFLGRQAMQTLGIVPADGGRDALDRLSSAGARGRVACRITTPNGKTHPVSILFVPLCPPASSVGALFVIQPAVADLLSDLPEWALRDPVTGLGNRHVWEREAPAWSSRSGCVVFLDLEDLKEVNDLYGHVAGDRLLAAAGRTLAAICPPDALTVRFGGDEFVVVLPELVEADAEAWALNAVRHVAASAPSPDLPIVPRFSHGVAKFGPGGLREAVQRADDRLYERKGVLLSGTRGGRIILTREGRSAIRGPGDDRAQPRPGAFGVGFGPEFEAQFRAQYARAAEQAREFVDFVDPEPGSAVVEVGAGSGRVTFDGGLAERIGRHGQLLVTDPSGDQMQTARRHAQELHLDWVRFLRAPAEELPLASGTVDLAIGALFLQFTDARQALREISRVVRPNGEVAISAGLPYPWPPAWREILSPVHEELERHGLVLRHFFTPEGALRELLHDAGLDIERHTIVGPEYLSFQDTQIAMAFWRANGLVRLLLRGVPPARQAPVQDAFEARLQEVFARTVPEERRITLTAINVVARKPG